MPPPLPQKRQPLFAPSQASRPPQPSVESKPLKKKKGSGKLLAILIILFLTAVLIVLVILFKNKIS